MKLYIILFLICFFPLKFMHESFDIQATVLDEVNHSFENDILKISFQCPFKEVDEFYLERQVLSTKYKTEDQIKKIWVPLERLEVLNISSVYQFKDKIPGTYKTINYRIKVQFFDRNEWFYSNNIIWERR